MSFLGLRRRVNPRKMQEFGKNQKQEENLKFHSGSDIKRMLGIPLRPFLQSKLEKNESDADRNQALLNRMRERNVIHAGFLDDRKTAVSEIAETAQQMAKYRHACELEKFERSDPNFDVGNCIQRLKEKAGDTYHANKSMSMENFWHGARRNLGNVSMNIAAAKQLKGLSQKWKYSEGRHKSEVANIEKDVRDLRGMIGLLLSHVGSLRTNAEWHSQHIETVSYTHLRAHETR